MNTEKQSENTNTFSEQTKRLEQQINFIREMDKEKFIGRQTYLSDGKRKENDAEHAWHLALMTFLLSEYANEPIISPVLINHKLYLSLMLNWVLNLFLKHTLLITSVCAEFLKILTFSKTPCVSGAW